MNSNKLPLWGLVVFLVSCILAPMIAAIGIVNGLGLVTLLGFFICFIPLLFYFYIIKRSNLDEGKSYYEKYNSRLKLIFDYFASSKITLSRKLFIILLSIFLLIFIVVFFLIFSEMYIF